MARSTLYHDEATPPVVRKGHGTAALGPSDSTDSGSDIQGGPGLNRDDGLLEPTGNTSDPDVDGLGATAGPDIGDANLDSDSDRFGTGERAAAGRDSTLATDEILRDTDSDEAVDGQAIGEDGDREGAERDELVGSDVEQEDLRSGEPGRDIATVASYKPAQAGQDVEREAPAATSGGEDEDIEERDHARADRRHLSGDDLPVFDRGGREDLPRKHSDR